jgi:hypothetical protein
MMQKEARTEKSAGVVQTDMTHLREGTLEVQTMTVLAGMPSAVPICYSCRWEILADIWITWCMLSACDEEIFSHADSVDGGPAGAPLRSGCTEAHHLQNLHGSIAPSSQPLHALWLPWLNLPLRPTIRSVM